MKRLKGFTLVELTVTVLVVIILMSISVPVYRANLKNYKKAEGYALLATIRAAQEKYYSEWGEFLASTNSSAGPNASDNNSYYTCNDEVLGINARTNNYYTWFCVSGSQVYSSVNLDNEALAYSRRHVKFTAEVVSKDVGRIYLNYNLTSGVTFFEKI